MYVGARSVRRRAIRPSRRAWFLRSLNRISRMRVAMITGQRKIGLSAFYRSMTENGLPGSLRGCGLDNQSNPCPLSQRRAHYGGGVGAQLAFVIGPRKVKAKGQIRKNGRTVTV